MFRVTATEIDEIWIRQGGASEAHIEVRRRDGGTTEGSDAVSPVGRDAAGSGIQD